MNKSTVQWCRQRVSFLFIINVSTPEASNGGNSRHIQIKFTFKGKEDFANYISSHVAGRGSWKRLKGIFYFFRESGFSTYHHFYTFLRSRSRIVPSILLITKNKTLIFTSSLLWLKVPLHEGHPQNCHHSSAFASEKAH